MRTGRPKMKRGEAKGIIIGIRIRREERRILESKAKADGLSLSEWIRRKLLG